MDDTQILTEINKLVDSEHELRQRHQAGDLSNADEQARLARLEESLDQCWDLLRRRRAAREVGANPDGVRSRPIPEVESYLQ